MANDDVVSQLVSQLLVAVGVHCKGGSVTLHMDPEGRVQQIETKVYRKFVRKDPPAALRATA